VKGGGGKGGKVGGRIFFSAWICFMLVYMLIMCNALRAIFGYIQNMHALFFFFLGCGVLRGGLGGGGGSYFRHGSV